MSIQTERKLFFVTSNFAHVKRNFTVHWRILILCCSLSYVFLLVIKWPHFQISYPEKVEFSSSIVALVEEALAALEAYGPIRERPQSLGHHCEWVQFVNGTVLVKPIFQIEKEKEAFVTFRRYNMLELIRIVLQEERVVGSDFEFQLCIGDVLVTRNESHPAPTIYPPQTTTRNLGKEYPVVNYPLAALNFISCDGSSQIPFPVWEIADGDFDEWPNRMTTHKLRREAVPFSMRLDRAVFRGGERSCSLGADLRGWGGVLHESNQSTWKVCGRTGLVYTTMTEHPELYDVALTDGMHWERKDHSPDLWNWQKPYVTCSEQELYKAVIYLGGHAQWATRLKHNLLMGSVLIYPAAACREFYALGLQPWVHFVPVDHHLKNLSQAVQWVLSNEAAAKNMVSTMNAYGESILGLSSIMDYSKHLLAGLAQLVEYSPTPLAGLVPYDCRKRIQVHIIGLSNHPLGPSRATLLSSLFTSMGFITRKHMCDPTTDGGCASTYKGMMETLEEMAANQYGLVVDFYTVYTSDSIIKKLNRILVQHSTSAHILHLGCKTASAADVEGYFPSYKAASQDLWTIPIGAQHSCALAPSHQYLIDREGAQWVLKQFAAGQTSIRIQKNIGISVSFSSPGLAAVVYPNIF